VVPFGKKRLVGLIIELATSSDVPASRLRTLKKSCARLYR